MPVDEENLIGFRIIIRGLLEMGLNVEYQIVTISCCWVCCEGPSILPTNTPTENFPTHRNFNNIAWPDKGSSSDIDWRFHLHSLSNPPNRIVSTSSPIIRSNVGEIVRI
jgi:hypothetical protein